MSIIVLSNAIPDGSLNGGITNVATSLTLQTGEGATFPSVPFKIGINSEAMLVTAKSTDTFTVTRNYDGTTATAHSDTDVVKHIFTAEDFPFRLDDTTDDYMMQKNVNLNGKSLLGNPVARMVNSSDQSISTTTETEVAWGVTDFESETGLVSLSDNGFVAPLDGYYRADVFLAWTTATPAECRIRGYVDDVLRTPGHWMARVDPNSSAYKGVLGNGTFYLEAGEILTFQVYFTEAVTLRGATAGEECWATFNRVG